MPLFSFEGKSPTVAADAFVAPTATLIGDVTIEAGASVWFNAVLRGDDAPIYVRAGANVQDGAVLHGVPGAAVEIGSDATVAHLCLVHGARIGAQALIGNQATVLDGAVIGAASLVAAGALVLAGTQIPEGVLAVGAPAKVKGPLAGTGAQLWVQANPQHYRDLAVRYRAGLGEIS